MIEVTNYKETINRAYELACIESTKARQDSKNKSVHIGDRIDDITNGTRYDESELWNYLNSLDEKSIKVMLAVMYIGRDFDEEEYRKMNKNNSIAIDSNVLLEEYMRNIPGDKEISHDIHQIYSKKLMLDIYYQRAIKILGLQI